MKDINQQGDVEMETFLHKDQPRENGRVTEYTVIPLDELPEKYSSDWGLESDLQGIANSYKDLQLL